MSPSRRYSVLLHRSGDLRRPEFAKSLSRFKGIPLQDAALQARRSWGFAGEGLDKGPAEELARILDAEGLKALALPSNLVEELPEARLVARAELAQDGFRVFFKDGRGESLPWGALALVAAAAFDQPPDTKRRSGVKEKKGLGFLGGTEAISPLSGERHERTSGTASDVLFYLEISLRKPIRRFRIDAQHFDYACLEEGMGLDALGNFRKLLERLTREAPESLRNHGARCLAKGSPLSHMGYESLKDLDREVRWLLTLEALRDPE